jgi:hypothetical protein
MVTPGPASGAVQSHSRARARHLQPPWRSGKPGRVPATGDEKDKRAHYFNSSIFLLFFLCARVALAAAVVFVAVAVVCVRVFIFAYVC